MEEQNKQSDTRKSGDSEFLESDKQRLNEDGFDEENAADSTEDEDFGGTLDAGNAERLNRLERKYSIYYACGLCEKLSAPRFASPSG